MAHTFLKFKDLSSKTQGILEQIEEDSFDEILKDPEVVIVEEDNNSINCEELLEAGARLLSSERKNIFRGKTNNDQIILIAGDKESEIRDWLENWIPEEDEESMDAA